MSTLQYFRDYYAANKAKKLQKQRAHYAIKKHDPEWMERRKARNRKSEARNKEVRKVGWALGVSRPEARKWLDKEKASRSIKNETPEVSRQVAVD